MGLLVVQGLKRYSANSNQKKDNRKIYIQNIVKDSTGYMITDV